MSEWLTPPSKGVYYLALAFAFVTFFSLPKAEAQDTRDDESAMSRDDTPMIPPPPRRISEEEVRRELDDARENSGEFRVADFQPLLRLMDSARTSYAFQWLLAEAEHVASERPGRASTAFRRRMTRAADNADVIPGFVSSFSGTAECDLDFDDPEILASLPNQAGDTFTFDPFYAQPCGEGLGLLRVEPLPNPPYNHYHLGWEDPTIDCYTLDTFEAGRTIDGVCVAIDDPVAEPRQLGSHDGGEIIRIWRSAGFILIPQRFSVVSFANVGGQAVKFRYKTPDGNWFQWDSLAGQTTWDLSSHNVDAVDVHISTDQTSQTCGPDWEAGVPGECPVGGGPFFLDDFQINPIDD